MDEQVIRNLIKIVKHGGDEASIRRAQKELEKYSSHPEVLELRAELEEKLQQEKNEVVQKAQEAETIPIHIRTLVLMARYGLGPQKAAAHEVLKGHRGEPEVEDYFNRLGVAEDHRLLKERILALNKIR